MSQTDQTEVETAKKNKSNTEKDESKAQTDTERESENSQKNETDKQTENETAQKETETEKEKSKKKTEKSKKNESKIESKSVTRRHYIIEREGNKIKKMIPLEELPAQPQPQIQQKKEEGGNWVWGLLAIVGLIGIVILLMWWYSR